MTEPAKVVHVHFHGVLALRLGRDIEAGERYADVVERAYPGLIVKHATHDQQTLRDMLRVDYQGPERFPPVDPPPQDPVP